MDNRNAEGKPCKRSAVLLLSGVTALLLFAAAALLTPGGGTAPAETDPTALSAAAEDTVRVKEGAELYQTLTYTRCEHVVTRRITAPVELYGKTLEQVEPLYPEWRVTSFSPKEIKMEQRPDIFCPDHMVLMPNGAGALCVFENKYGDALALVRELDTDLRTLPAAVREELEAGVGFSSLAELEQWLESAES